MTHVYFAVAFFLLLTLLGGLTRIRRGPTRADRMLTAQFFGTTGAAILLLLGEATEIADGRAVALVFVLLAVVNSFVFVHSPWQRDRNNVE